MFLPAASVIAAMFVASTLLVSCSPRIAKNPEPPLAKVHYGAGYAVWQERGTEKFFIHADTSKRAEDVVRDVMGCAHRICIVQPNGVIWLVQLPSGKNQ